MKKEEKLSEENVKFSQTISGSHVSSREVSLDSSGVMNISSLRDSRNLSDDSDIRTREKKKKPRPDKLSNILRNATGVDNKESAELSAREGKQVPEELTPQGSPINLGPEARSEIEGLSIEEFYKKEREKLNIWTYLYRNLNRSIRYMMSMCELEGVAEFCGGVIDLLDSARSDFVKLGTKIKVENLQSKAKVWDIPQNVSQQDNTLFQEYKNYAEDDAQEEEIEFKLLNELVSSGKMSFYEAVVLIVRERAMLIDQAEFNGSGYEDSDSDQGSDRSLQPAKVSFSRLIRRLNFRGKFLRQLSEVQELKITNKDTPQTIRDEIDNKLKRAMEFREELINKKKAQLLKKEEKLEMLRKKREETEREKIEEIQQKVETGYQRKAQILNERKRKARDVNLKAREIIFLNTLENDTKKTTIDRKLLETHNRRMEILKRFRERRRKEDENAQSVIMRKEELDNEKKSLLQSRLDRMEEASKRRNEILEQRSRKHKAKGRKIAQNRKAKHLQTKGKNIEDFMKIVNNLQSYRLGDEDLEVKSCQLESPKEELKRHKSYDHGLPEFNDFHYSYIFFKPKPKELKAKMTKNNKYMSLEQVFAKKFRPSMAAKKPAPTTPGQHASQPYPPQTKKDTIVGSGQPSKKDAKSSQIEKETPTAKEKADKKKSHTNTALNVNPQNSTPAALNSSSKDQPIPVVSVSTSIPLQDSPKRKTPHHKGSIHSIDEKEKNLEARGLLSSPKGPIREPPSGDVANQQQAIVPFINNEDSLQIGGISPVDREKKGEALNKSLFSNEDFIHNLLPERSMIRFCTLCDITIIEEVTNDQHLSSKNHKKLKNQFSLTVTEEKACIISCLPTELAASRLAALKKKCKRIRQTLGTYSSKNENIPLGKESATSPNKTRLHKCSVEIEKQINNQFRDFKSVEGALKDVQKILSTNNENDLHILRSNKFLSHLVEICKSVNLCHKNDLGNFVKLLDLVAQLLHLLCSVKENRTYMLTTNRVIPLVDLLLWSWNNASKYIYCLNYIPQLFHLVGFLLKHKIPDGKERYTDPVIEYIIYCGLLIRFKQRFTSFSSGLDLTSYAGKVPLALLKAISLLETITNLLEVPGIPVMTQGRKLNESISFLFRETEIAGCLQLMSGLLLSGGSFKKMAKQYVLPQTIFSVVMLIVKLYSNVARLELGLVQELLGLNVNVDQFYHCVMFILDYCTNNLELNDEVAELLNETLLLLGYFTYLNPTNQAVLSRGFGNNTIIARLTTLPYNYFMGNTMERDVLFPTLLCAVYKNDINLKLLLKDMSIDLLLEYLQSNISVVSKHIQFSELGSFDPSLLLPAKDEGAGSRSASSATSSANSIRLHPSAAYHYLLPQRFSPELWDSALKYLQSSSEGQ